MTDPVGADDESEFTPKDIDATTRKVALKLLAASRDAARESRFEGGSRKRKADIAADASALVAGAGNPELAAGLSRLALKLRTTDCWGTRPRQGLSATFGEAARLLHPTVEDDLRNLQELSNRQAAKQMADVFSMVLGGAKPREDAALPEAEDEERSAAMNLR